MSFKIRQRTPLHLSAYDGHVEVSVLLWSAKADVNARDNKYNPYISMWFSKTVLQFTFHQAKHSSASLRYVRTC
jgi:hypothetical protein